MISADGKALFIIPTANFALLQSIAETKGLYVTKRLLVAAIQGKQPYVILVQLEMEEKPMEENMLTISDVAGDFTKEYKELTSDFYLNF